MSRTVVVFGAGAGLGQAVARRFGREGYRVALVARDEPRLAALTAELAAEGIEAAAFPADLTRTAEIPALVGRIRERFERIDVIEYAPITTDLFIRASDLDVPTAQHYVSLYLLTPVAIVREVLPEMLARGDGGILIGQGISAVRPMPNLSGLGPAMAAARNYVLSLHGEIAAQGVYAGVLHIAAMIRGSAGHRLATSGELSVGVDFSKVPTVEPADLAETMWTMLTKRDRGEDVAP
ncbi:SDR family NAD(P)-dependent oxidoreductase [Paractinoplanes durhamensis]|uniref:Short-chain dehydrogenase n=1 Tax=Paractinoplanes durhamensis TaxID=113563 RepID=A0ABQ3YY36_9ACTN|nr:SDR family NAD(P)-dependent oxidoreductase [Actinoplanes durhamensis]GIE02488.1 short-chain dehydrogenase [Actinoplanes durhamensis]